MSGHSKWSTIKHKKAVIDAKRSGVFTKMANAVSVAVKKGGGVGDPDMNFTLRLAIDKARAVNMPKENIERAIEKGMGKGGDGREMEELVLEGYGPGGIALIIEAVTDNRNRTVSEVKNILEKAGGRLGEPGSVMYQFDRVGEIEKPGTLSEELELELIDQGLIDFEQDSESVRLYSKAEDTKKIFDFLKERVKEDVGMMITYRAKAKTEAGNNAEAFEKLLEGLDDNEDVQEIYANAI